MRINIKYVRIYYCLMLLISISVSFFGSKKIDAYGQVILMLSSFPVFAILGKICFNKFSDGIETKYPDLFDKYKMNYGVVRRINGYDIFNNSDFEKSEDYDIKANLKLTKQLLGMTIISFFSIIIFAISFMMIKR
jgi:hypothetical protein